MADTLEILKTNLPQALWETFFMVGTSAIIGVVFGLLIGLVLFLVGSKLFHKNVSCIIWPILSSMQSVRYHF